MAVCASLASFVARNSMPQFSTDKPCQAVSNTPNLFFREGALGYSAKRAVIDKKPSGASLHVR